MQTTGHPKITVNGDGRGVVGRAGTRLPVEFADVTGLTGGSGTLRRGLRAQP
jgi:hypothetical protein